MGPVWSGEFNGDQNVGRLRGEKPSLHFTSASLQLRRPIAKNRRSAVHHKNRPFSTRRKAARALKPGAPAPSGRGGSNALRWARRGPNALEKWQILPRQSKKIAPRRGSLSPGYFPWWTGGLIADEDNVATCGHRRARGRVADRLYEIVDYLAAIIARGRAQSRQTGSRRPARRKRWWPPERL